MQPDIAYTLEARAEVQCIAFPWQQGGTMATSHDVDLCGTLVKNQTHAVAVSLRGRDGGSTAELGDEVSNALRASQGGGDKAHVLSGMTVRRLTPRECERLQGMPDDWTLAPNNRGKPMADGPRYKMCGNGFTSTVIRWIGERIEVAHECPEARAAA